MSLFRHGRRLFSSASIGLIVVAVLHTIGQFGPEPEGLAFKAVKKAMESYTLELGFGMEPSIHDISQDLSFTMSVTLLMLGAVNLLIAARDSAGEIVQGAALISVAGVGALVGIAFYYRIPPPLITLAIVEVLFVLSLRGRAAA